MKSNEGRFSTVKCCDGTSVYGRLITNQQPSLLAWTHMLDLRLGGKFCNCSKSASCFLRSGFNTATFKAYGMTPFLRDMIITEVSVSRMMGKHVFRTDAESGSRSHDFVNVFTANFFTISKVTCWKLWICTSQRGLSEVWDELRSFSGALSVNALCILSILLKKKNSWMHPQGWWNQEKRKDIVLLLVSELIC